MIKCIAKLRMNWRKCFRELLIQVKIKMGWPKVTGMIQWKKRKIILNLRRDGRQRRQEKVKKSLWIFLNK